MSTGCKKEGFGDVGDFTGTWQIVSLRIQTFDTQGRITLDSVQTNLNDAEIKNVDEYGNFNPILFDPRMSAFKPIGTLYSLGATLSATNGRMAVYFSPDIDNDRINFWCTGPGGSYSDIANVTKFEKGELHLAAVKVNSLSTSQPTLSEMHTLIMRKR